MSGTPIFLITDAGLAAASVATPTGPYIHITSFEIGSAYGYTPQETDTGLNGTLLYTGTPTSYEYIGNNTLNIICEIPPDAGPFQFGEVGLFLDGGVMFAKAVFDLPQTKFSSLGTNVVSSYTLNCLLKLQQSTAVFQIDTINAPPGVVDIYQWSDVYPPGISANPDVPLYVVRELNTFGDSSILSNTSDAEWTQASTSYVRYYGSTDIPTFPVANATTSWVQIAASLLHPTDLTQPNRRFLLQTADGFFRSVNNVVTSGSNYQFNLNVTNDGTYNNIPLLNTPAVGSHVTLYRDDNGIGGPIYYSQIVDPPSIPIATSGTPGLAYGGSGTYMPGGGAIDVSGLLHSPSTNTGRVLTSADNLDNAFVSGVYSTTSATSGLPANMPVAWDGTIIIQTFNSVMQVYYPGATGGGTSTGDGGYPIYFRSAIINLSNGAITGWTSWMPVSISGRKSTQAANFQSQWTATNFIPAASSSHTIGPLTFTPATYGQVMGIIIKNNAAQNGTSASSAVTVTSSTLGSSSDSDHTQLSTQQIAVQQVAPGDTVTIEGAIVQDAGSGGPQMGIKLTYIFIPQW